MTDQFPRTSFVTLFHFTLMLTSAQVVEMLIIVTDNSPFQHYSHLDDHTTRSTVKPFTEYKVIMFYLQNLQ